MILDTVLIPQRLGELNWSESTNFEEGLKKTVDWYLSNQGWWKNISQDILKPTPWKN